MLKLEQKVQKSKGTYISATKAAELDRIIHNMNDDKTSLEEEHFRMRTDFKKIIEERDSARALADSNKQLLDTL